MRKLLILIATLFCALINAQTTSTQSSTDSDDKSISGVQSQNTANEQDDDEVEVTATQKAQYHQRATSMYDMLYGKVKEPVEQKSIDQEKSVVEVQPAIIAPEPVVQQKTIVQETPVVATEKPVVDEIKKTDVQSQAVVEKILKPVQLSKKEVVTEQKTSIDVSNKSISRDAPWVSLQHQRQLRLIKEGKPIEPKKTQPKKTNSISVLIQDSVPELSADKFEYSTDGSNKAIALGNAKVDDKNYEINADKIEYAQTDGYANAIGDVSISTAQARLASDSINIDIKNDAMKADYVRFGSAPIFIEAKNIDASDNIASLNDATLYFGEPSWVSLNANASTIKYSKETDILEMEDATLSVGDVPFMYVPYYSQKGLKRPPFNVDIQPGYNGDYGAYIRNDLYYNGFEGLSTGILLDYYSKRSVLIGPALEYDTTLFNSLLKGWFKGAYINDHASAEILGVDSLGNAIGNDRYFFEMRHSQQFGDNFNLTASITFLSDEFVTRDFRPSMFYDNQVPDNFVEANYYGDFYTVSAFTRFAPNDWEVVQERLPELRVDVAPVEIFDLGLYQTAYVSYVNLNYSDPISTADIFSNRVDSYYGLSRPIKLNSWSTFTPVVGAKATYYANTTSGNGSYTRILGQVGFDSQMDIWGTFDYQSETMGIDGIRHHMIPQISYRYIPNADQGIDEIPQIDTDYFTTYPPILDLGTLRNVDEIYETNTMRFGLQNIFETRDSEYGSREIARFDLFQDINFTKRPISRVATDDTTTEESFSDLYVNVSVSPARWLTIGNYTRFNWDTVTVPETNTYIGIFDGDALSVYFMYMYSVDYIDQYAIQLEYRISERYKVYALWAYDLDLAMLTEQTYGLWTRMGNNWVVEYVIQNRNGSTRQNDFSFGVRLSLLIF